MTLVQYELQNAYIGIPYPESISLDKNSINLTTIGQTEQLTATLTPDGFKDTTIIWTSSDNTIATVSSSGLVTCVTPGECTITATTVNNLTATCSVSNGWMPTVNTICYFPLNSDLLDASGNGYSLTASGSATIGSVGSVACLDCSSASSYVSGVISGIPQGQQARTNMCWIRWTASGNYPGWQYGSTGAGHADIIYSNNSIGWSQYGEALSSGQSATTGQWCHVAVTTSGGTAKIYVNGVLKSSSSMTINTSGTTLYLARGTWDNTYGIAYYSNMIIENRTWTDQEIADYFDLTKSLYGIS